MIRMHTKILCRIVVVYLCMGVAGLIEAKDDGGLKELYEVHAAQPVSVSDIGEHLPVLCALARECSTVVEIGLRDMESTYGILQGLSENTATYRYYLGIDIAQPSASIARLMRQLAHANGIYFHIWQADDMLIEIPETELLFIDSLHIYCHLTYELEKFSSKVTKYIAMHDTSEPWGNLDDNEYYGDYSEYPANFDKTKRGLWPAVEDFLNNHPEWKLQERRLNCHGFTILKKV